MPDRRIILLSQGEVRPGVVQGQHWGERPTRSQVALSSSMYRDVNSHILLRGPSEPVIATQDSTDSTATRLRIWPF